MIYQILVYFLCWNSILYITIRYISWLKPVLIQRKRSLTLLTVLIAFIIATPSLVSAGAPSHKLTLQNIKISPKIAKIGENVRVEADIRNIGKNTTVCDVTAFVGESVIEEFKGISISSHDSHSLLFTIDTSSLPEGKYSVDMVVQEASSEEATFDLGTIAIEQTTQEQPAPEQTIPEQTTPEQTTGQQESYAGLNVLYLLAVFPLGAAVAFVAWKRQRKSAQGEESPEKLLPNLLNEVLNFEENVEKGAEKTTASADSKNYIR